MLATDMVELICAAHLGHMVDGPFDERGGIMLVGPPSTMKTTFVSVLDRYYPDAVMLSDINVKSLVQMRDAIASGRTNTLVLPELQKIYERADVTSSNVEGTIRALAAEGFHAASFQDSRQNRMVARAFILAALVPELVEQHFPAWETSGYNRRFLWPMIRLKDPLALEKAAVHWTRIPFQISHVPTMPLGGHIPNITTVSERRGLALMVKYQPGGDHAIQIQILTRILAVLKWWYRESGRDRNPMEILEAFAPSLHKGVDIELPPLPEQDEIVGDAHAAGRTLAQRRWQRPRRRKARLPKRKKPSRKKRRN